MSTHRHPGDEALNAWRQAEAEYAAAASGFFGEGPAPRLRKRELVALVGLRVAADRWREEYFRACRGEDDDAQ